MSTLVNLIRHGQTDWNVQHRIQGTTDIPLNAVGRRQARDAVTRLVAEGPWDAVVSSPLIRALETAQIIATGVRVATVELEPGLVERNFGEAEGLTDEERNVRFPPGTPVPGSETREQLRARALAAIDRIADTHPDKRIIVVAHGGLLGQILRAWTNESLPGPLDMIQNASSNVLERQADGSWRLVRHSILFGVRDHAPIP